MFASTKGPQPTLSCLRCVLFAFFFVNRAWYVLFPHVKFTKTLHKVVYGQKIQVSLDTCILYIFIYSVKPQTIYSYSSRFRVLVVFRLVLFLKKCTHKWSRTISNNNIHSLTNPMDYILYTQWTDECT